MKSIGERISSALTAGQLAELIDAFWRELSEEQCDDILETVPKDVFECIDSILSSSASTKTKISKDKLEEHWGKFVQQIDDCISELGDEEGKYIYQERDWEPPEFDESKFSDDIEKAFIVIRPHIEQMAKADIADHDFISEFLRDVEKGLTSYPEWMGVEYTCEHIEMGVNTTHALLTIGLASSDSIGEFIDTVYDLEAADAPLFYDSNSLLNFFYENLSSAQTKEAYHYLKSDEIVNELKKDISRPHSHWCGLVYELASSVNPADQIEHARLVLERDWTYGPALVDHFIEQNCMQQAREYCIKTIQSYTSKLDWSPLTDLAMPQYGESDKRIDTLLGKWIKIEEAPEMCEALRLNRTIAAIPKNYEKIRETIDSLCEFDPATLIQKWIPHAFNKKIGKKPESSWETWLIECGLSRNSERFVKRIKIWLQDEQKPYENDHYSNSETDFTRFSAALLKATVNTKSYPRLYAAVTVSAPYSENCYDWLNAMGSEELLKDLLSSWEKNIKNFIPTPTTGDYSDNVNWLLTAQEVNNQVFSSVLADWSQEHWRKRNLWSALKTKGIEKLPLKK